MANRPANTGSGGGLAPVGDTVPALDTVAPPPFGPPPSDTAPPPSPFNAPAPPPVHHGGPRVGASRADASRAGASRAGASRADAPRAGHRATRSRESARDRADPVVSGLAWLPYLIVLAGVAVGMFVAWQGSRYAGRGAALVGCSLLAAGLARLVLPPRYAAMLTTRRKASDVLTFAVFGAAVLVVALMLP